MKRTLFLLGLFILFVAVGSPVLAEETEDDLELLLENLDIEEDYRYEFPEIEPSAHLHLGYRFVDLSGADQVFEYEKLESSMVVGGDLRLFNYPHRFYLDFDFENREDYFTDLRYAHGDLIVFRYLGNSFYHNLENIRLSDFDPLTLNPGIGPNLDGGYDYGINSREHKFNLRLKTPRFPAHAYVDGFYMVRDGAVQQRNLLGSGYYNNMQLTSQIREYDSVTRIYKFGANSHLGPVEVDFSHTEKEFSVGADPSFVEAYTGNGFRAAGSYEHSRIPELEGSGNELKVHSSFTGKWVASATISQDKRENNYSGAESEVIAGSGSVMWSPLTNLSFALRYTHRDLDNEVPATLPVSYAYTIKPPVSSETDTLTLTGRYKPVRNLTFRAKYLLQKTERENAALWNLTDSTTKNSITLTADSRLHSKMLFNVKYAYKNVADPAYNTEPEHSHIGRIGLTLLPKPGVSLLISYDFNHQERDNLSFISTGLPWYREVDMNNLLTLGTFQVSEKFTLSASYSYMQYEMTQDLAYEDLGGVYQVDRNVPMDQRAHVLTFGAHYRLSDSLYLFGEVSATRSKGEFTPSSADLLAPVSIGSFSKIEQSYLLLHLGTEYKFSDNLSFDIDYRYKDLEDNLNNIYEDIEDGEAHILTVTATKKW